MTATRGLTLDDPTYFDRLAEIESGHWWSVGMRRLSWRWLDRTLAGRTGLVALDVGCGAGGTAAWLAEKPEVAQMFGVDPSRDALRHASRRGIGLVAASALSLPFDGSSFDLVTCLDVLQHLGPDGDGVALREIARVLRPGGVALIRSNGRGWMREADRPADVRPYRLRELREVVLANGLAIERSTYANCLPAMAQEVVGRLVWPFRGNGGMLPHPSRGGLRIRMPSTARNRLMGAIAGTEAYLAGALGVSLPFGHSTMVLARRWSG